MFDYTSGAYTELEECIRQRQSEGYNTETISDDEMFVYVPETTTPETTAKLTTSETETKNNITNKQEESTNKND